MKKLLVTLLTFMAIGAAAPSQAATLQEILDRGSIKIASYIDAPPMGFVDAEGKPAGLDVELAQSLADALGVTLELQQVTAANRLPYLLTGKVDMLIAGTSATFERARQVMLSNPYANSYLAVWGAPDIAVTAPEGLADMKISVPKGSIQETALIKMGLEGNLLRLDNDAAAYTAYFSGQSDLVATTNVVMNALLKQKPDKQVEVKFPIVRNPQHMVVRQGDFELLQFVNTFIFIEKVSGRLDALHRKWIGEPLGELPN